MTYIYLVENCYGDPNKVYIGKTINSRENDHKRTYGNNIKYTIIDQISSKNRNDWRPIETMWIQSFMGWGFEVVNLRKEGGGGMEFWTEKQKQTKSIQAKEMWDKRSEDEKNKISVKQSISQTGTNGYPKGIPRSQAFKDKIKGKNGYPKGRPRTKEEKEKISKSQQKPKTESHKQNISLSKIGKPKTGKPITQHDLEGNFIREWSSRTEAKKWLGMGDIAGCLAGKQQTAGGYFWKYKN
jgi:hypothetical protein